jgi:hypothetical protein
VAVDGDAATAEVVAGGRVRRFRLVRQEGGWRVDAVR